MPANGLSTGGPSGPEIVPGVIVAGWRRSASGWRSGPEARLIALGAGLAALRISLALALEPQAAAPRLQDAVSRGTGATFRPVRLIAATSCSLNKPPEIGSSTYSRAKPPRFVHPAFGPSSALRAAGGAPETARPAERDREFGQPIGRLDNHAYGPAVEGHHANVAVRPAVLSLVGAGSTGARIATDRSTNIC